MLSIGRPIGHVQLLFSVRCQIVLFPRVEYSASARINERATPLAKYMRTIGVSPFRGPQRS